MGVKKQPDQFTESIKDVANGFAKSLVYLFKNGGGAAFQLEELIKSSDHQKSVFKDNEEAFKQFRGLLSKLVDNFNLASSNVEFVAGKKPTNFFINIKMARAGIGDIDPRHTQRIENTHLTLVFEMNTTVKTKRTTAKFKEVKWGHTEPDFSRPRF